MTMFSALPPTIWAKPRMICAGLALGFLVATAGCAPVLRSSSGLVATAGTQTPTVDPLTRIHNAQPDNIPLFVRVTFTPSTTYEQAIAALNALPKAPYPWTCDEPRSNVPPPLDERKAAYAATHSLLLSYATWKQVIQMASLPQVVSVDGTYVYPCP